MATAVTTHSQLPLRELDLPRLCPPTDLRVADLVGVPVRATIMRLDTDQGITGWAEVRHGASRTYALLLKSRLIGASPCNLDLLFRRLRQFEQQARQAGRVSRGRDGSYGSCRRGLRGSRLCPRRRSFPRRRSLLRRHPRPHRPDSDGRGRARPARARLSLLQMDIGLPLRSDVPGSVIAPPDVLDETTTMHPFAGTQLTRTGIDHLVDYVDVVRDIVGYDIPLAADHFGQLGIDSRIRLGQALEPVTLAWLADLVPWQLTDQWRHVTNRVSTPTCTRGDIYLLDNARPLPTLARCGSSTPTRRQRAAS